MSKEILVECCGTCTFAKILTPEQFNTINSIPGNGNRRYDRLCTSESCNMFVATTDSPHRERFSGINNCYSPRNSDRLIIISSPDL